MTLEAMRVLIAGGGTGGHLYPGIALAEEIKSRSGGEVLFVGAQRGLEARVIPAEGYPLELLEVSGIKRTGMRGLIRGLMKLPRALSLSREILKRNDPAVVVGVGGYASGPVVLMAALMGYPTAIQEQNSHPGFTNKVLRRFVDKVFIAFDDARKQLGKKKTLLLGNPVRRRFIEGAHRPYVPGGKRLVVVGGSQGARAINDAMIESLPGLRARTPSLHIVHQTGEHDYERVQAAYAQAGVSGEVHKFIEDMPVMFARADLLVCRSGASTVAEITAAGKAAVFVPFPRAADDHQNVNARALERMNAAVVVEESNLEAAYLVDTIAALINDPGRLERMSEAAKSLAHPQAVQEISAIVKELVEGSE
jgi:UDP-N-acetylglucosamine--N-acetylmuramyl-(pentapeptide) pyrophosphoryl-undecaprenol N-acetylglucosamine transferase